MDSLRITGGVRLSGTVQASGAKNAALPIMAASILASDPVTLERVPDVIDVSTLALLLGHLGVAVKRSPDGLMGITTVDPQPTTAGYELVRRMRASFCVLGPLLARRRRAVVSLPGGCQIGTRPVDLHLAGLEALGAELNIEHGYVIARAQRLRGAEIQLSGPAGPTVTGTANVMSAATLAEGRTIISGAALEPEIVDLGMFLNALGAKVAGLGTSTLEIEGVPGLSGGHYRIIADRIEAGTLLVAAAMTLGTIRIEGANADHLGAVLSTLNDLGCQSTHHQDTIELAATARPRPLCLTALPYPGIPTDLQSQFVALAALASGRSTIRDGVFPDRFMQVAELNRLGAQIQRVGDTAVVQGVGRLSGASVIASDLRASAALVLAGLAAEGETVVRRIYHLDRGYERLDGKLALLGARIVRDNGALPSASVGRAARARQPLEEVSFQRASPGP